MDGFPARLQAALGGVYRFERELGGGGMSRVFLAEEIALGRRVVVKVLPPEFAVGVSTERFRREIQLAASLQHPHIVPLLQAGAVDDVLYYTMPYIDGESLRTRLARERQVPAVEAARILRDVADALDYAHRHGVAHRDIKPDNILLAESHAVVTDFGVAKALSAAAGSVSMTATGLAIGTPMYMAPEQAAGDPAADHRVDVYALAAVAYEMLAGRPPFGGSTPQAILAAQLTGTPVPLVQVRPDVPPALAALVERGMARAPEDRFQQADELLGPLTAMATPTGGMEAARLGLRLRLRQLTRRFAVPGALLVVAAVFGAWQLRSQRRAAALLAEAMPAAEAGRFDDVYAAVARAGADVASRRLRPLAARAVGRLDVEMEPADARVEIVRVTPLEGFAGRIAAVEGRSPLRVPLVAGEYFLRLRSGDGRPLEFIATVSPGSDLRVVRRLLADSADVVYVPGGSAAGGEAPGPFRIGRTEVTNAQFARFVEAGGYRNASLWPDTMLVRGARLPREAALRQFVDRTGVPGPQAWSGGAFGEGLGEHPVTGVSWYEAAACARWEGGRLPTLSEWYRAALGDLGQPFPWGADAATAEQRANFGLAGTEPVGRHPLSVSPFGAQDMAGNVREWIADDGIPPTTRVAVGGSWQEPAYGFDAAARESMDPASRTAALGFRVAFSDRTSGGSR
jgi:hypothetical protein